MPDETIKHKIYDVLKGGYFNSPDDLVDVSNGDEDCIHVVVVSRKFEEPWSGRNDDLLWSELTNNLSPEEWGRISLSVARSPEEIKAF